MTLPRFDWLAPHYEWIEHATYGNQLHWCRTVLLGELTTARRVLIPGEGDGRFLAAFLTANHEASVDVVDASPAMIELARTRIGSNLARRVRWHFADARTFEPAEAAYDLIVTNFFLDCFPASELEPLVSRLARSVTPGGRWLLGDFALPEQALTRFAARAALAAMYLCFSLTTRIPALKLANPRPFLEANGLALEREEHRLGGFLTASLWRSAS